MTWNMARNTEKTSKIRKAHCTTWNMAKKKKKRKKKNMENEKCTLNDLVYSEKKKKHRKTWKMRNGHFRTSIMARNIEKTWK
jgi:hypothetical protein